MCYRVWVALVLIDERKNGSGRKLLNPPESEGHLAISTSYFIPVTDSMSFFIGVMVVLVVGLCTVQIYAFNYANANY